MKSRSYLVLSLLACQLAGAAESGASRQLIIAAVGEIPVPRLRVVEAMGRRGYEEDEKSTHLFFPNDWKLQIAGASTDLVLNMNLEPAGVSVPAGEVEIAIRPTAAKPGNTPPKTKILPATSSVTPMIMVVFNREPQKEWNDSYSSVFVTGSLLDPAKPAATVLNLSGATLMFTGQDQQKHALAPGQSAVAPIFVNKERTITMLPLSATDGTKTLNLDVCPIDTRGLYCPLVVVFPSIPEARQTRPLRVSIIDPSSAVQVKSSVAVTSN